MNEGLNANMFCNNMQASVRAPFDANPAPPLR